MPIIIITAFFSQHLIVTGVIISYFFIIIIAYIFSAINLQVISRLDVHNG